MTINLPPEIEDPLTEEARRRGTTPELLAVDSLRERFVQPPKQPDANGAQTLYDVLKDHIGTISSSENVPGGARLSEDCGKKFAEGMNEKRRQGKL